MNEDQDLIYDDDEAVKFIQNYLPQELKDKFSDDDINYIVDLIYEFYDSKGYFDDNDDDDAVVDIDEDELIQYVIHNAQKDGVGKYKTEEIALIVQGELEYCESIDLFE
jgi:DNA-directed RNA polymerase specialized sigma54-like protein